jgi:undecaprenyl-diphosphatase
MVSEEPSSGHPSAAAALPTGPTNPVRSSAEAGSSPRSRLPLLLIVCGFIALFTCMLVFGAIAEDVHGQEANALDTLLTPLLHSLSSPFLDSAMNALTALGSPPVVLLLLAVALTLLIWRRHRAEALFLVVAMVGSVVLNESLKLVFHRPRPELAWAQLQPEYSFPSGHAMNSLVLYGALALIAGVVWGRRVGLAALAAAIIVAIAIGASRIYLGYHYFTDVVGGLAAGAGWLLLVALALGGARMRRAHAKEAAPARPRLPAGVGGPG